MSQPSLETTRQPRWKSTSLNMAGILAALATGESRYRRTTTAVRAAVQARSPWRLTWALRLHDDPAVDLPGQLIDLLGGRGVLVDRGLQSVESGLGQRLRVSRGA